MYKDEIKPAVRLLDSADLAEGAIVKVRVDGSPFLLARVEGVAYALVDRCPHLGCPLSKGSLSGAVLTCACHDWRFDVRDGKFVDAPEIGVETKRVFEENGAIRAIL